MLVPDTEFQPVGGKKGIPVLSLRPSIKILAIQVATWAEDMTNIYLCSTRHSSSVERVVGGVTGRVVSVRNYCSPACTR